MTVSEKKEAAEKVANLKDAESMKNLFNAAANAYYLEHTQKSFEELNEYLSYETASWTDGLLGDEWDSVADCINCAEEKAQQVIESEKTPYDELVEWAIDEISKIVHQFAPQAVIDEKTKIFDLLPAGEERDDYEEKLAQVMCQIYRRAAEEEYLQQCSKEGEEEYRQYGADWDANCGGTEWENIWFCIACGEEAADAVLEEEREAEEEED